MTTPALPTDYAERLEQLLVAGREPQKTLHDCFNRARSRRSRCELGRLGAELTGVRGMRVSMPEVVATSLTDESAGIFKLN